MMHSLIRTKMEKADRSDLSIKFKTRKTLGHLSFASGQRCPRFIIFFPLIDIVNTICGLRFTSVSTLATESKQKRFCYWSYTPYVCDSSKSEVLQGGLGAEFKFMRRSCNLFSSLTKCTWQVFLSFPIQIWETNKQFYTMCGICGLKILNIRKNNIDLCFSFSVLLWWVWLSK